MVSLSSVKVNYQHNPVGIQSIEQIGWKLCSDQKNVLQLSYQLQLASDKDFHDLIYDSGITVSLSADFTLKNRFCRIEKHLFFLVFIFHAPLCAVS